RSAGMLHLVTTLMAPMVLLAVRMHRALLILLVVGYLVPLSMHPWLPVTLRWAWHRVGWLFRLLRVENCSAGALATWLGARLAARAEPYAAVRVVLAAVVVWLIVAASNAFNDLQDVQVDRLNKPQRPIPSGLVPAATVSRTVVVLAALALLIAWTLEWYSG